MYLILCTCKFNIVLNKIYNVIMYNVKLQVLKMLGCYCINCIGKYCIRYDINIERVKETK